MLLTTEKIDIPSVNNLTVDEMPSTWSLMYIKKSKCAKTEPCGTPASTGVHAKV